MDCNCVDKYHSPDTQPQTGISHSCRQSVHTSPNIGFDYIQNSCCCWNRSAVWNLFVKFGNEGDCSVGDLPEILVCISSKNKQNTWVPLFEPSDSSVNVVYVKELWLLWSPCWLRREAIFILKQLQYHTYPHNLSLLKLIFAVIFPMHYPADCNVFTREFILVFFR